MPRIKQKLWLSQRPPSVGLHLPHFISLPHSLVIIIILRPGFILHPSFAIFLHGIVLVGSGCYDQKLSTGAPQKTDIYFLPVLDVGSPRSGSQYGWALIRALFLACSLLPLGRVHRAFPQFICRKRVRGPCLSSLLRAQIPSRGRPPSDLI